MGTDSKRLNDIPEVTAENTEFLFSAAEYLVIIRETVIGIPEDVIVSSSPKTVNAI